MSIRIVINGREFGPPEPDREPKSFEELETYVRQGMTMLAADDAETWDKVWPSIELTGREWSILATIALGYADQLLQMLVQAEDPYGVGLLGPEELATPEGRAALVEATAEKWRRIMAANAK